MLPIELSRIRLDISTICQLKCPSCTTASGIIGGALGSQFLKFDDFKKIVDANPSVIEIEIANRGEIFLNPDLLKIVQYAHEKRIIMHAYGSNLNTASDEVLEGLVKYGFRLLSCSIDGASNETYQIYRRGGDFDKVIANIKRINEFKARYRSTLPILHWQFIIFGHNEHEIPLARQMARDLGMEFKVKLAYGDFSPVMNKEFVRKESGLGVSDMQEHGKKHGQAYQQVSMCSQLWNYPQINSDGRVLGCCVNLWGDYGNVFSEDLAGIVNNERMNYARGMVVGENVARQDIPCARCHRYEQMKKTGNWVLLADIDRTKPAFQKRPGGL